MKIFKKDKKIISKPVWILGEKLDKKYFPVLYDWAMKNPQTLEAQLSALAKITGGSVVGAMQNLETDLQHIS